ncbi:Cytochrome b5 reductase 4 [Halotydeus destructor]|nr:Cytochrome b5 reductase 4 [Halotydeus destructor]
MSLSPNNLGSGNATGSGRTKVALKPGHSLMDWVRLCNKAFDLAGTKGRLLKVTDDELAKHNTRNDCWMVIQERVYNVTPYMDYHPGGVDELMRGAGIDATNLFNEVHRWVNFESMLNKCLVGKYCPSIFSSVNQKKSTSTLQIPMLAPPTIPLPKTNLQPVRITRDFVPYTLKAKDTLTRDTYLFTFGAKHEAISKVQTCQHVQIKLKVDEEVFIRDYTPVPCDLLTSETSSQDLSFIIKVYKDGLFTSKLESFKIGDDVEISEPISIDFDAEKQLERKKVLYMISAGTGITPMISFINWLFAKSKVHDTKVCLLYFNKTENDIIWREKFATLKDSHPSNFHVDHVLSQADDQWTGRTGRISGELLESTEPYGSFPANEKAFFVCGPSGFTVLATQQLAELDCEVFAFSS